MPSHDAKMNGLPEEVLEAGLTRLTFVIHTSSANPVLPWERIRDWPEESGGQAVLEQIVARSQAVRDPTSQIEELKKRWDLDHQALHQQHPYIWVHVMSADPVLLELLAPERSRQ